MTDISITKTRHLLQESDLTNPDLVERLNFCGIPADWGWAFCRTAGCHRCRKQRVKLWINEAISHFGQTPQKNLRFVTVMLQPVPDVADLPRAIKRGKVELRNLIFRLRQLDERAHGMRLYGAAEIDWYSQGHVARLSSYKTTQLRSLGWDVTAENVWMPHFHLVVDLAGVPEHKFSEFLSRQWPGHRQVDIRPLDILYDVRRNLTRLISYSMKHKHFYKIDALRGNTKFVTWPDRKIVAYYNMLFEVGGFSLLRCHLKPTRSRLPASTNTKKDREPMPLIIW